MLPKSVLKTVKWNTFFAVVKTGYTLTLYRQGFYLHDIENKEERGEAKNCGVGGGVRGVRVENLKPVPMAVQIFAISLMPQYL
jgi:hypothetical protein